MTKRPLIIWSELPASGRGNGRPLKYARYVLALRERPNHWACLQRGENPAPLKALAAQPSSEPYQRLAHPHRLEVVFRPTDSGDYGVWARLIPPAGVDRNGQPLDIDTSYQEE